MFNKRKIYRATPPLNHSKANVIKATLAYLLALSETQFSHSDSGKTTPRTKLLTSHFAEILVGGKSTEVVHSSCLFH